MRKAIFVLIFALVFAGKAPLVEAQLSGYYEKYEIKAVIENDRSINIQETLTYVNTAASSVKLTLTRTIPSNQVENIRIWDGSGQIDYEENVSGDNTRLTFETNWISAGEHYTYYENYSILDMVYGSGVEYRVGLWSTTTETRYDNYTIILQGPAGTYPFLTSPEADLVSTDPPTWRYSTVLGKNETFGGLRAKFYGHPAYYKVKLSHVFSNNTGSQTTGLGLDTILLNNDIPWQFSSVVSSSLPVQTMYFDEDNNLHAIFDVGDIPPGGQKLQTIEILYEVDVYAPGIDSSDVGNISEVPATLSKYLQPDDKWESNNSFILQATQQAVGTETNAYTAAEKISDYVVNSLNYEIQDRRQGGLWAASNQKGDCSEYTDLSIAIARAAGIPARALYGWGYYEEENLRGHAWLEYYLPNVGWVPADPTWAETSGNYFAKLDPIHLTRNVRGVFSSESWENIYYYGSKPDSTETENIQNISSSEAAQLYLTAAQYHLSTASQLMEGVENSELQSKLAKAQGEISAAQGATAESEIILRAKNAINYSDEVVQVLGKPPETAPLFNLQASLFFLAAVLAASAVAGGVYALKKRKRDFH